MCVVYDCLYPWTVGGAERWYAGLVRELADSGCEVTYLTRLQWDPADPPVLPGVRVVAVSPAGELYDETGRRRTGPPLRFGAGVLRHLRRHAGDYDVIHTNGFPFFSVLAIRLALLLSWRRPRPAVVVEWVEVWTRAGWRDYLGRLGGAVGHAVQRWCVRSSPTALSHSHLHAARLPDAGYRGPATVVLSGLMDHVPAPSAADPAAHRAPLVVFAGRHIPEKRVDALPAAIALARVQVPALRAVLLGDGPERDRVLAEVDRLDATDFIEVPGFVSAASRDALLASALCLVQPSSREGHGMVVVEAAALATPSVVVAGPDNAAVELVQDGVTGVVAPSASARDLADAIVQVVTAGPVMRQAVADWYAAASPTLGIDASARVVRGVYDDALARR